MVKYFKLPAHMILGSLLIALGSSRLTLMIIFTAFYCGKLSATVFWRLSTTRALLFVRIFELPSLAIVKFEGSQVMAN